MRQLLTSPLKPLTGTVLAAYKIGTFYAITKIIPEFFFIYFFFYTIFMPKFFYCKNHANRSHDTPVIVQATVIITLFLLAIKP